MTRDQTPEPLELACGVGAPALALERPTRQTGDELSRLLWRLEIPTEGVLSQRPGLQLLPWHPPWSFSSCSRRSESRTLEGAVGSLERGYPSLPEHGTWLQTELRLEDAGAWPDVCPRPRGWWQWLWGRASQPDFPAQRLLLKRPPVSQSARGPPPATLSVPALGQWFIRLTTVARLGMCLTEFSTSSSVTSTSVQFSSSDGNGSAPCLVTQGCSFNE